MIADQILIRFGELSTKGKNKNDFIKMLFDNVKIATKDILNLEYKMNHDRIYIKYDPKDEQTLIDKLKKVSGIANFSKVYKVEKDINVISESCLQLAKKSNCKTFKVKAKRADKNFEIHSDDINRIIATNILKNTDLKVDVHNPDLLICLDIRLEGVFIYCDKIKGAGGYPYGIAGKGLVMMSGGLDSPIAAYMAMNRGIKIECIHFASPPYTQEQAKVKVIDLIKVLSKDKLPIRLHIVPFTDLQVKIYENVDESYCITIMRRMMYRIATRIARNRNCVCLINGESVGQVASQTLQSMEVINEVTKLPIIRPLACIDKVDIIEKAREIGTYDISIRPFIDCCTIFTPKNPVTRPQLEKVSEFEAKFDFETLVNECVKNTQSILIDQDYQLVDTKDFL